ncbi:MAG: copper homeostasis protein CutC [Marinilabiliales bacterium]
MSIKFEVCCYNFESVLNALKAGADRIELCDNYYCGGTTPSYGLIKKTREISLIPIHVLIHPGCGTFICNDYDIEIMISDILMAKKLYVDGIVIGLLTKKHEVDINNLKKIMDAAGNMSLTFHKAFDLLENPYKGIDQLIELGFDRILTSGGQKTAKEGILNIKKYQDYANNRIIIMPGGQISSTNISEIASTTGATEFHFSAINPENSDLNNTNVPYLISDINEIKKVISALRKN